MANAFLSLLVATGIVLMLKAESRNKAVGPRYDVLSVLGERMEIRRYGPRVVAEVEVFGDDKKALNEAFRILAAYIFGKNNRRGEHETTGSGSDRHAKIPMMAPVTSRVAKIPMTAPVTVTSNPSTLTMRFFMPGIYTLVSLPEPKDRRIKLVELPEEHYAAISFSGSWNRSNFSQHASTLIEHLKRNNIKVDGSPENAYYDPPFMPSLFRHNEVLIPIGCKAIAEEENQ